MVVFRDQHTRSKGYVMSSKENKKATQDDIDQVDNDMRKPGFQFTIGEGSGGNGTTDRMALASNMVMSTAAASVAGGDSTHAWVAARFGVLRRLLNSVRKVVSDTFTGNSEVK